MALDCTVTAGYQFSETDDPITNTKLNLGFSPTVSVSGNLAQLANVATTSPANGQPLVYNTGTSKWGPGQVAVAYLANGSPNTSYFLRGDGQWADPATTSHAEHMFLNQHVF